MPGRPFNADPLYDLTETNLNRAALMHLAEVAHDARRVADEINAGEYDSDESAGALQVELEHLMGHLALAWHYAIRTDEQIDALTPEQFGALMNAIPKVGLSQTLVDPWDTVV